MNTLKKLFSLALVATILFSSSCSRDNDPSPPIEIGPGSGLLVLNEGVCGGGNNASITHFYFETQTATQDVFFTQNDQLLGDCGNYILVYGGRVYIALGGSATIEVTDLELNSIRRIRLTEEGPFSSPNRQPMSLAAHNGNVFIVCFSGYVLRLDTLTLGINNAVRVGDNPENIAISNGFAYVTNSGGLNFDIGEELGSTVSVVNLATFTEVTQIEVGLNPYAIAVDGSGNIIVSTRAHWGVPTSSDGLHRINATTHTFDKTFEGVYPSNFVMNGDIVFYYRFDWATMTAQFIKFNTITQTKQNFIDEPSLISLPHAININPVNGDIYISNAEFIGNGSVFVFDSNGDKRYEFPAGLWPKRIAILR